MAIEQQASTYTAQALALNAKNTQKVLELLLNEECTIPFIARYRKEVTGGLDEIQITSIQDTYNEYIEREKRRSFILESIAKQEQLTKELEAQILAAKTLNQLEDLYAPYKSKRKTKGTLAKEAGLLPLAELLRTSPLKLSDIEKQHGSQFINKEKKIENFEQALEGAKDIIVEEITQNAELRDLLRNDFWQSATMKASKKKNADEIKEAQKFKDYFDFEQKVKELKNPKNTHRYLAMRRGMLLKILKVEVCYDEESALATIRKKLFDLSRLGCAPIIEDCISRAYKVSIYTSLDLEIKNELKQLADESAIEVFRVNLKNLLLQPYLGPKAVIGIDPGVRTGCKVAVIDQNGKFLADTVIYPHPPQNDQATAARMIETCIEQLKIEYIAIGNGTYGRETLQFIKDSVKQVKSGKAKAMLVNEDGASVYSASEIARNEFPDKDLTVRGAISIARRFQDPLAELVKIDPKSIGVGQYQHDVNQTKLKKSLGGVVENCVNYVGVDLNTASAPLLSYISGIGPSVATNIVKEREKIGGFNDRQQLLKVSRLTPKVFEQSAGFLRIYNGKNPLDGTFIHPERYRILESWCKEKKLTLSELVKNPEKIQQLKDDQKLQDSLGTFTHDDIVKSLLAPSQDPRTQFVSFEYRNDISEIKDLKVGQWYPGIITNITQFGAFVDIGIKENGLVHVSQMSDQFVENALDVLKVGQEVKARVMEVDLERKRISLSLKSEQAASTSPKKKTAPAKKNAAPAPSRQQPKDRKPPRQQDIRNNAFDVLKNLKLK